MELYTQISAMVGTSLVLYLVTKPRDQEPHEAYMVDDDDRSKLKGVRRYSSYHRKKLYRSLSKRSRSDVSHSTHSSDNMSVSSTSSDSVVSNYSR